MYGPLLLITLFNQFINKLNETVSSFEGNRKLQKIHNRQKPEKRYFMNNC